MREQENRSGMKDHGTTDKEEIERLLGLPPLSPSPLFKCGA